MLAAIVGWMNVRMLPTLGCSDWRATKDRYPPPSMRWRNRQGGIISLGCLRRSSLRDRRDRLRTLFLEEFGSPLLCRLHMDKIFVMRHPTCQNCEVTLPDRLFLPTRLAPFALPAARCADDKTAAYRRAACSIMKAQHLFSQEFCPELARGSIARQS